MNKFRNLFFATLILLLCVACGNDQRYAPLPKGTAVLAFGDSVTHGTGAKHGEDYPQHLAVISGWNVTNGGISGDTAAAAKGRIEALLQNARPRLVIVELGGNDLLRRRPESEVKEDLRTILQAIKRAGATPVLVAVPEVSLFRAGTGTLADADLYAELAKEEMALLIPGVMSKVLSDASLRSDRIHPNANGYQALASGIANALSKSGLLRQH